ncbi:hypothetical protein JAAARDRAFT_41501 [Jaapia argillacea MUCL 33604]|uniref:Uncharacterized protein n=1 Tax=Jaapia argillacea MUCL 33604 TaxID=933084 RepID=A0A067P8F8_9AGAM|nr:hypothetical protein JAAARDRAFT_41501 [Jaapia argillacea MUCL 33604]
MVSTSAPTFSSLFHPLEALLLRALSDLFFARPTLVEQKAIPQLALEGNGFPKGGSSLLTTCADPSLSTCSLADYRTCNVEATLGCK